MQGPGDKMTTQSIADTLKRFNRKERLWVVQTCSPNSEPPRG